MPKKVKAMSKSAIGVVQQVKLACKPSNRLATIIGFLLGGFVPIACYWISHHEQAAFTADGARSMALVFGGLAYSARTVYEWAKLAFTSGFKSLGFVVLVEGTMVTSSTLWLSIAALCYLVVINGVATGCTLSLGKNKKGT